MFLFGRRHGSPGLYMSFWTSLSQFLDSDAHGQYTKVLGSTICLPLCIEYQQHRRDSGSEGAMVQGHEAEIKTDSKTEILLFASIYTILLFSPSLQMAEREIDLQCSWASLGSARAASHLARPPSWWHCCFASAGLQPSFQTCFHDVQYGVVSVVAL